MGKKTLELANGRRPAAPAMHQQAGGYAEDELRHIARACGDGGA